MRKNEDEKTKLVKIPPLLKYNEFIDLFRFENYIFVFRYLHHKVFITNKPITTHEAADRHQINRNESITYPSTLQYICPDKRRETFAGIHCKYDRLPEPM